MSQTPVHLVATSSQTVGPFFHFGLADNATLGCLVRDDTRGERIRLRIGVFDGDGAPVPDALVELWQADADGVYVRPAGSEGRAHAHRLLWIRTSADRAPTAPACSRRFGRERSVTRRAVRRRRTSTSACSPGGSCGRSTRASTLPAIRRSESDAVLALVPEGRRRTLLAQPGGPASGSSTSGCRATPKPCSSISDRQRDMSSRLIDSLATTDALAEVFSDRSILQAMLDFEAALARAEVKAGVIPEPRGRRDCRRGQGRALRRGGDRQEARELRNRLDSAREGAHGARAGGRRRERAVRPLRRDESGRRGLGDGPHASARPRHPRRRSRASRAHAPGVVRASRPDGDAGADAAAARAADHVRSQGRGLGRGASCAAGGESSPPR